jgi:hypothetical protein
VTLLAQLAALVAIVSTGVVYGTDAFCALVQRPALARVDDATLTAVMGHVHRYGDRRMPAPGILGIITAAAAFVISARIQHASFEGNDGFRRVRARTPPQVYRRYSSADLALSRRPGPPPRRPATRRRTVRGPDARAVPETRAGRYPADTAVSWAVWAVTAPMPASLLRGAKHDPRDGAN